MEFEEEYWTDMTHALQMVREATVTWLRRQWLEIADEWSALIAARLETRNLLVIVDDSPRGKQQ